MKDGTGEAAPHKKEYVGELAKELIILDALAKQLRKKRFQNGAVKFDREELHFDVDEKGKPIRCYYKKSKDANKLIEEFMLLANRTVAESIGKVKKGQKAKTLPYRIHDQPDPTKLENLRQFVARFGYKVKTAGTKGAVSKSLNKLMDDCNGRREQNVIEMVALRAMMKAMAWLSTTTPISPHPSAVIPIRWCTVCSHAIRKADVLPTATITKNSVSILRIWNSLHSRQSARVSSTRWWSL